MLADRLVRLLLGELLPQATLALEGSLLDLVLYGGISSLCYQDGTARTLAGWDSEMMAKLGMLHDGGSDAFFVHCYRVGRGNYTSAGQG